MATLKELNLESLRELIGFACLTKATLAINDAAAATFKSTGTITYLSDGLFKTKSALSAQAFSTGHAAQAVGETGYYVVSLNAGGTVSTTQHVFNTSSGVAKLPDVPDGNTPIGIIKVVAASAVFTPGTTALDAAGVTVTYHDCSILPAAAP